MKKVFSQFFIIFIPMVLITIIKQWKLQLYENNKNIIIISYF